MKTRVINTKFWIDDEILVYSPQEKTLFLYYLTNAHIELTRIYKLSVKAVAFETGINIEEVQKINKRFEQNNHFFFIESWIYINNDYSYCDYQGGKTSAAKEKELSLIPKNIKDKFLARATNFIGQSLPNHCPIIGHINHNTETINDKPEIKSDFEILKEEYAKNFAVNGFEELWIEYLERRNKELRRKKKASMALRACRMQLNYLKDVHPIKAKYIVQQANDKQWDNLKADYALDAPYQYACNEEIKASKKLEGVIEERQEEFRTIEYSYHPPTPVEPIPTITTNPFKNKTKNLFNPKELEKKYGNPNQQPR